jgi:hypothetical protein
MVANKSLTLSLKTVCGMLVHSKWLDSYHLNDGRDGLDTLRWSPAGIQRKDLLGHVVNSFHLYGPGAALAFTESCRSMENPAAANHEDSARHFWSACMDELDLPRDRDLFRAFMLILNSPAAGLIELLGDAE